MRMIAPFILIPSLSMAQVPCGDTVDFPAPPACIVGNWVGTSDAAQVYERFAETLSGGGVDVSAFPTFPEAYGVKVYADGFYVTLPFHANAIVEMQDEDGKGTLTMDLSVQTQTGQIWEEGSGLQFCANPAPAPMLQLSAEADGQSATTTIPIAGEVPRIPITSACGGRFWVYSMDLPQPIGPVTYEMTRFPDSRFDEEFREMAGMRFGVED